MSSEVARFVLSSFTLANPPGRRRLDSRMVACFSRMFSGLLCAGAFQFLWYRATLADPLISWSELGNSIPRTIAMLAVALYLWVRPKPIVATKDGLEVGTGKKLRLIPWSRVLDVREMPSVRWGLLYNPSAWQVDLDQDERFDFFGTSKAREIVKEYIARAEGSTR